MARFRTQLKHLVLLLTLGYGCSLWLLNHASKKPNRHVASRVRVQPRPVDESLTRFIRRQPLKDRFEIERRHISYNTRLGRDDYDSAQCSSWPVHYLRMKQTQQRQWQKQREDTDAALNDPNHRPAVQHTRRFIVHSCENDKDCGDLSNRMMSAASLFIVSLLTDREFFVDWQGHGLGTILRTPFISLRPPQDDAEGKENPLPISLWDWEAPDLDAAFDIRSLSTFLDSTKKVSSRYQSRALETRELLVSSPQLDVRLNRGLLQRIITDPSFGDRLNSMGLFQHNAYECVLSFLFRPTMATEELIHQYQAVFRTPGLVTIGIHFPSSGVSGGAALDEYEHSMPCAKDLTKDIKIRTRNPEGRFLYVIFAEDESTKRALQDIYGSNMDLIFPPPPRQTTASLQKDNDPAETQSFMEDEESVLLNSHLFSEMDYLIMTSTGFSKVALFRKGTSGRRSAVLMPSKTEMQMEGGPDGRGGMKLPDCRRVEDAVVPWDMIASLTSLG